MKVMNTKEYGIIIIIIIIQCVIRVHLGGRSRASMAIDINSSQENVLKRLRKSPPRSP